MRAAVLQGNSISVQERPDPVPGPGQLLVAPIACGICGSDIHLRAEMAAVEAAMAENQRDTLPPIVPGHEFSAEFVAAGPDVKTSFKLGDRLTAIPFTNSHADEPFEVIGLSPNYSGGLADLSVVDASRAFSIPESVPSDLAALTEPLAVGLHAAGLANRSKGPNVVIGCGPVGLAVIFALKRAGRGPILAADFSAERRAAAEAIGADIVVDPSTDSPYTRWADLKLDLHPISPLLAREFAGQPAGANIFECVGAPGLIDQVIKGAPPHAHIIVVGVCGHEDKTTPLEAIVRELTVEYSFAYRPEEFAASLREIADAPEQVSKFVTSRLPLAQTGTAFDILANEAKEIKVLIDPRR